MAVLIFKAIPKAKEDGKKGVGMPSTVCCLNFNFLNRLFNLPGGDSI